MVFAANTIFILKFPRGIVSQKSKLELKFLFSAHRLMMLYICTKFHENIFDACEVIEPAQFSY